MFGVKALIETVRALENRVSWLSADVMIGERRIESLEARVDRPLHKVDSTWLRPNKAHYWLDDTMANGRGQVTYLYVYGSYQPAEVKGHLARFPNHETGRAAALKFIELINKG